MWARRYSSKWHRISEVEEYVEINWRGDSKKYKKAKLQGCGMLPVDGFGEHEGWVTGVIIKDKVNIWSNSVCTYCRNNILKNENIESALVR